MTLLERMAEELSQERQNLVQAYADTQRATALVRGREAPERNAFQSAEEALAGFDRTPPRVRPHDFYCNLYRDTDTGFVNHVIVKNTI